MVLAVFVNAVPMFRQLKFDDSKARSFWGRRQGGSPTLDLYRKTMGKPWENDGTCWYFMEFYGIIPSKRLRIRLVCQRVNPVPGPHVFSSNNIGWQVTVSSLG